MAPFWADMYKLFNFAYRPDPISRKANQKAIDGVGVTQPDAIPDIRADNFWGGGSRGALRLRDSNDFIDLSSVTNRQSRYKEYERLLYVSEIDAALTIFADECCVAGDTQVSTPFGFPTIKELAETKKPEEKFLVYCYDFTSNDYTLGWAYHPRKVRTAETVELYLDNGERLKLTPDHRILLHSGRWITAGELKEGDELMPFYRLRPFKSGCKSNQFPRIYTHVDGWKHERQFVDEWRLNKKLDRYARLTQAMRRIRAGLTFKEIAESMGCDWDTVVSTLLKEGFTYKEAKQLYKRHEDRRRVIGVSNGGIVDVYDLSVDRHENFATNCCIVHNCQKGDNGHIFDIKVKNASVKKEADFFFWKLLKMDRRLWNIAKKLFQMGDLFLENVIDPQNPSAGILKVDILPSDSIYRIETTKGKLLEFQQSKEGPDYQSLSRVDVTKATEQDLAQATALRFAPEQIVHMKIGDDRKTFYPYGVSLIEPARGPAHQLRLMEDSMVVYRLSRAPERRVFYIDTGNLPPNKVEALMERMKDQLRKKKVYSGRQGSPAGASSVEERWHIPSADEDIWLPTRPNSNSRIETLPGACLALDTEIPLLDGRTLKLSEIIEEHQSGKQNWVYSCNPKNGSPAPGKITWAGVTRKNTEVVKITFDNGKSIVCTPDHKFPLLDKGKTEAKDLKAGDSLIPFNYRHHQLRSNRKDKYAQIYDTYQKKWVFVHRWVSKCVKNSLYHQEMIFNEDFKNADRNTIHHKNFNKFDNNPENLTWMNFEDHIQYHQSIPFTEERCQKISNSLVKFHEALSSDHPFYNKLKKMSVKANNILQEKLQDEEYNKLFAQKQSEGWQKAKENPEFVERISNSRTKRNNEFWANPENKEKTFKKQTVVYPQEVFNYFVELLKKGKLIEEIIPLANSNESLINKFTEANAHIKRNVDFTKGFTKDHIEKMVKVYGFSGIRKLRNSLSLDKTPNNSNGGRKKGGGVKYPKIVMDSFMQHLVEGKSVKEAVTEINKNPIFIEALNQAKIGVGYATKINDTLTVQSALKMVRFFGYEGLSHAKEQASFYNHKVVSVEYLTEKIDTGTITVDGNHELHDYHTFALTFVYSYNSNLGEIDDAVYFRNKLLIALNMPKNYLASDDPTVSQKTLSSQDVKFARMIERLQMSLADGMLELLERHLRLRGFPQDAYDDLDIAFTPPSEWREISRQDILTARYGNASTLKGSQMMADFDIYVDILKIPEDKAKEYVSRNKMQKIEDAKIQAMIANPELLGVGQPGGGGTEMGGEPGGPSPMLGGETPPAEGTPPPPAPPAAGATDDKKGMAAGSQAGGPVGKQKNPDAQPLPDVTDEDVKKYDMSIKDYSLEKDEEEIDQNEIADE
jgi:intein/homing endonuclease